MNTFYSHGKLLITGEYLVLDGALALAIPTKYGQSLRVERNSRDVLVWKSLDHEDLTWYRQEFNFQESGLEENHESDDTTIHLRKVLISALKLNPGFNSELRGRKVVTKLEFPNNWGLGSSSTLINNIAQWAEVDPYSLLDHTFGGSGYDIACASHNAPILFQRHNSSIEVKEVGFMPAYSPSLYFVHLNRKQSSREAIASYRSGQSLESGTIREISDLTKSILNCEDLESFKDLIDVHEIIMSEVLNRPTVKSNFFPDFDGSIKSLGAWGGDFILVASAKDPTGYFQSKGFNTIIPFNDMILK